MSQVLFGFALGLAIGVAVGAWACERFMTVPPPDKPEEGGKKGAGDGE